MRLPTPDERTAHFRPRGGLIPSSHTVVARLEKRVQQLEAEVDRLKERLAELEIE